MVRVPGETGFPRHVATSPRATEAGPAADLPQRLARHLRESPALLPEGGHVLIALSGGPDSTALLHLLVRIAPEFGWRLTAAHFDHAIRPGGRERTDRLRKRVASLGVALLAGRPARPLRRSHEELRSARYAWLRQAARHVGADRVATGHQRDDQVETILFRIIRGTGNRGLAGIPGRRGCLARPLLGFGRGELADWLAEQGIPAFDDPSNRDPHWARSRLRHRLIPALAAELGADVPARLLAIGSAAGAVREAGDAVAERVLAGFADGSAAEWPAELRAEALRLAARRAGVRLRGPAARRGAAAMIDLTSGHGLDLGGGLRLEREFDGWIVRRPAGPAAPDRALEIRDDGPGAGEARIGGRTRRVRWGAELPENPDGMRVALHVSEDHYPLTVRGRSAGDRIRLPGGTRKVSRLLIEARVPRRDRQGIVIVADRRGRVLCAMGLDDRVVREAATNTNFVLEVDNG